MTSSGQVRLSVIKEMLRHCADGALWELKLHKIWVTYKGKTFYLPKGEHGKTDAEIERPYVKKLVRFLEIDKDCALSQIPGLR